MTISREAILELLEKIQDPDLKKGLVTANLVDEIQLVDIFNDN